LKFEVLLPTLYLTKDDFQDPHPGQPVEGGGDGEDRGQAHLQNRDSRKDAIWHLRQVHTGEAHSHRLNMELDLQSLFGILCTAVLIS
jgi:hypothetical protein